MRFSVNQGALL